MTSLQRRPSAGLFVWRKWCQSPWPVVHWYLHTPMQNVLLTFPSYRYFDKCRMRRVQRYTLCRRNFKACSDSHYLYSMGEGYWIVRGRPYSLVNPKTDPVADNLGLMPYRRRIVAVSKSSSGSFNHSPITYQLTTCQVGKPIHVEKCEKPNLEQVIRVQKLYIEELTRFVKHFNLQSFRRQLFVTCQHLERI